jgi:polysaccharide lyase family 4-like protein
MKKPKLFTLLALTFFTCTLSAQVWAYQEVEVKNGGTLQGRTTMKGHTPSPRVFHLVLYPNLDMCAEVDTDDEMNRLLFDFVTDEKRGMKDVVVTLEHVESGKPFPNKPINILSEDCKFTPEVNILPQGGTFFVDNQDAVMHNSQVYQSERGKIILNIPIPAEEISDGKVMFKKHYRIFQMICGMHEFMQTWGYRVQNPYYYQTKIDGKYKIDNIPPGEYKATAWHYLMKKQSKEITVSEGETIDLDFEFDGGEVIRPYYETIKSGRIKKDSRVPGSIH